MTEQKRAPGPWSAKLLAGSWCVLSKSGHVICRIARLNAYAKKHEQHARLIAAAPELLEAAQEFRNFTVFVDSNIRPEHGAGFLEASQRLRAAIAKAEGE